MSLIERIAARFGFERPRSLPIEMIVFRSFHDAREAGFSGARHRRFNHLRAWWPGAGVRGLRGLPIQRVTIPSVMTGIDIDGEGRLGMLLRSRQQCYGHDALWVEI